MEQFVVILVGAPGEGAPRSEALQVAFAGLVKEPNNSRALQPLLSTHSETDGRTFLTGELVVDGSHYDVGHLSLALIVFIRGKQGRTVRIKHEGIDAAATTPMEIQQLLKRVDERRS